jgi:GAF domain-containing protein
MVDQSRRKVQLEEEIARLRSRVAELEALSVERIQAEEVPPMRDEAVFAGPRRRLLVDTLTQVALALTSQTRREAVLDEIMHQVQRVVPCATSNIALLEDDDVRTMRWRGYEAFGAQNMISQLVQPIDVFAIDFEAIVTREPVVVRDSRTDPRWVTIEETAWIRSHIVVPICLQDRVLGLLRLDSDRANSFSEKEARLLIPFASAAAVALEQAHLYESLRSELEERDRARRLLEESEARLRRRNRELELLNRVGRAFNSILDLDSVLAAILEEARCLLDVLVTSIWLVDDQTGELICRHATGPEAELVRGWRLPPDQGLAGWVARHGEGLIVPDAQSDRRHFDQVGKRIGVSFESIVTVPLRTRESVIGVLQVLDPRKERFDEEDLRLVESLAATAAIAIDNARLFEQVRKDAETKATLLKEVNHRVKNNLSAIIGLLYVQRNQTWVDSQPAFQAAMDELASRVRSLAIVHQMLSESEWRPLLVRDVVLRVVSSSLRMLSSEKHITLRVATSPLRVSSTQAHNLAMVINELAIATIRHGIGEGREAVIEVGIDQVAGMIEITFRADGPGYPESALTEPYGELGLGLAMNIIQRTLQGELVLRNDGGAVTVVRFPAQT